jgi:hypothetical protein
MAMRRNMKHFGGQITEEFNKKAQPGRTRDSNQLKIHWSRLKATINDFNGFWSTVNKIHTSGYSDDQLMEEAQKLYERKYGNFFGLVHWWKRLKNEPKWCAQFEKEKTNSMPIDLTNDNEQERPIGREAAKAQRKGKRKAEEVMDGIANLGDNISKIIEVQKERKLEREKLTEAQLEISRLNL